MVGGAKDVRRSEVTTISRSLGKKAREWQKESWVRKGEKKNRYLDSNRLGGGEKPKTREPE